MTASQDIARGFCKATCGDSARKDALAERRSSAAQRHRQRRGFCLIICREICAFSAAGPRPFTPQGFTRDRRRPRVPIAYRDGQTVTHPMHPQRTRQDRIKSHRQLDLEAAFSIQFLQRIGAPDCFVPKTRFTLRLSSPEPRQSSKSCVVSTSRLNNTQSVRKRETFKVCLGCHTNPAFGTAHLLNGAARTLPQFRPLTHAGGQPHSHAANLHRSRWRRRCPPRARNDATATRPPAPASVLQYS